MDIESAKLLGAGIAVLGVIGSGIKLVLSFLHLLPPLEEIQKLESMFLQ